jgi:methionine-rich copper-binding protein CopC
MKRYKTIWPVALSLAIFLSFLFAGMAAAHNVQMTRSDPAAGAVLAESPAQLVAWFNEEMKTQISTIQVFDASGQQVDKGDGGVDLNDPYHASMAVSLPPLPNGAYTVRWHVVLLDDDPTDGEFTFYVGEKPAGDIAVSQVSAPEAPAAGAANPADAEPTDDTSGLPIAWVALGLGVLVLVAGLAALLLRSRSAQRALV